MITVEDNPERRRPWIIAVAGLMGAGKTTLATQLARGFGWAYIPKRRIAGEYLRDLFTAPTRWAFEAQLAMFCSKALEITQQLDARRNLIIDRSLEEDLGVFARYFYKCGHIDERAFLTYESIANEFLRRIGPPDVTIYCEIPPSIAWERILQRKRGEELSYPVDHVNRISTEYKEWIQHYSAAPAYSLDSIGYDWRIPQVAENIADELTAILKQLYRPTAQMDLFQNRIVHSSINSVVLKRICDSPNWRVEQHVGAVPSVPRLTSVKRRVYLAAPFTSAETAFRSHRSTQIEMTGVVGGHGRIPPGSYRSTLLAIANALRDQDFEVLLPHRDVNKWGEIQLSPDQVARYCTEHVVRCDVFVGVLGQSCGSHYEFGLALGLGKPCLILAPEDTRHSFVAQGVGSLPTAAVTASQLMVLKSATLAEAPLLLRRDDAKEFLRRVMRIAE